jgi:AcrR family transcriptional regulator
LEISAALFSKKGYDKTTTREIGAGVGLQKGSLYYHVRDKQEILYRICSAAITEIAAAIQVARDSTPHPFERLRNVVQAHVATMLVNIDFNTALLNEQRSLTGQRRAAIRRLRDRYERTIDDLLREGQEHGAIRADLSVQELRLGLMNIANWSAVWYRPGGGQTPAEIAQWIAELYLFGATGQGGEGWGRDGHARIAAERASPKA